MSRLFTIACLFVACLATAPAVAEDRLALVIGNAGYRNIPALANPVNDAQLMARALRAKGFRVTMAVETDRAAMRNAVERFGEAIRSAEPGALALFYFAGHGVRSDGFNYLLPVDVEIRTEADIAREAVAAEWVLERILAPGVTSVMVLDACRNNPFDDGGSATIPALGDGLARMTAREGNLIAYATGPGDVALDGTGGNSPYTAALARAITTPGLDLEAIFARVREEVATETAGAQIPWARSSLAGAVYMQPGALPRALPAALPEENPAQEPQLRLAVSFRPGRWGRDPFGGCTTLYRYDPVRLASAAGRAHRMRAVNGDSRVALEVTARSSQEGVELHILPVSQAGSGRPVTARLAEITPGREHTLYTHSRHPELFGCGAMTIYVSRTP